MCPSHGSVHDALGVQPDGIEKLKGAWGPLLPAPPRWRWSPWMRHLVGTAPLLAGGRGPQAVHSKRRQGLASDRTLSRGLLRSRRGPWVFWVIAASMPSQASSWALGCRRGAPRSFLSGGAWAVLLICREEVLLANITCSSPSGPHDVPPRGPCCGPHRLLRVFPSALPALEFSADFFLPVFLPPSSVPSRGLAGMSSAWSTNTAVWPVAAAAWAPLLGEDFLSCG